MPELKAKPDWLSVKILSPNVGVDRANKRVLGVIAAEEGPFKSEGRGEFDRASIRQIVKLGKEAGKLKAHFQHATLSDDGLGKFLGWFTDPRQDTVLRDAGNGMHKEVMCARFDLQLRPAAFQIEFGKDAEGNSVSMGDYVLNLAQDDPDAFMTSLVLQKDEEYRLNPDGTPMLAEDGEPLPPLWRPTVLRALDIVDVGDATNSFLSADILAGLPDAVVRQGAALLDQQFAGQTREVVKARAEAWLERYLSHRFGDVEDEPEPLAVQPEPAAAPAATPAPEPAEKLAAWGGLTVGDRVQWWIEDPDGLTARREMGIVKAVGTDGPLEIPGTSLSLEGTTQDPAALVADLDDETCEAGDECFYLVKFSKLEKVVVLDQAPNPGSGGGAYMAADGDDEALIEEIECRAREAAA